MADVIRENESKNQLGEYKATKETPPSKQKAAPSDATNSPEAPLDPVIARRVAASIKKHQEALEYLKNN